MEFKEFFADYLRIKSHAVGDNTILQEKRMLLRVYWILLNLSSNRAQGIPHYQSLTGYGIILLTNL